MSATVLATGVTHGTSEHVDFYFYAHTACGLRVDWKETNGELKSLDPDDDTPRNDLAVRTDKEVDCMACVAAGPREPYGPDEP
jgi:hypothetical protein